MKSVIKIASLVSLLVFVAIGTVAGKPGNPNKPLKPGAVLYYEGELIATIIPQVEIPNRGRDDFYEVPNQSPVVAVAPGDRDYHGGQWAFHEVMWVSDPYLLKSYDEVMDAAAVGDIIIMPMPGRDFLCPILKNG